MDRSTLRATVRAERTDPIIFLDEEQIRENAVALQPEADGWNVFLTSERGAAFPSTVRTFTTESDALDYMLEQSRELTRDRRELDEILAEQDDV